jgi:hypothetical protein
MPVIPIAVCMEPTRIYLAVNDTKIREVGYSRERNGQ